MTQTIKDFGGRILGTIEVDGRGNKTVKAFGGRILYRGDMASALLILYR